MISNNLIRRVGRDYVDAAGILVGFTRHTLISHNTIVGVPWSGIAVGWGWGLRDQGSFPEVPNAEVGQWGTYDSPSSNGENRLLQDRIHGFLDILWDGGAIYTTGHQGTSMAKGLLIEGNVASGKRPRAGGNTFYTDGGSRYITLRNNVAFDNPQGVTDLGRPPRTGDPLPYSPIPSSFNGIPYGSDTGGCSPYGDMRFDDNYWPRRRAGFARWSGWADLNRRPRAPKARALSQAALHPEHCIIPDPHLNFYRSGV